MNFSRRQFLAAAGATATLTMLPRFALAATAASDTRLLVVLLRGGLDGLHALQPYADPAYARLRGALAQARTPGLAQGEAHKLDGTFALHPALAFSAGLYARKQMLPVVAIAPPYRQRSHFDAQDCLENGTENPRGSGSGWLNRCVSSLAGTGALAVANVMPLILRGGDDVYHLVAAVTAGDRSDPAVAPAAAVCGRSDAGRCVCARCGRRSGGQGFGGHGYAGLGYGGYGRGHVRQRIRQEQLRQERFRQERIA